MADIDIEKGADNEENSLQPLLGDNEESGAITGGGSVQLKVLKPSTSNDAEPGETGLPEGPDVDISGSGDGEPPPEQPDPSWMRRLVVATKCKEKVGDISKLLDLNSQLLEAIVKRDFQKCESLLDQGANPNVTVMGNGHHTACHIAAGLPTNLEGERDILDLLLSRGAERDRRSRFGCTPIHIAAWSGNARSMATLLYHGGAFTNVDNSMSGANPTTSSACSDHQSQPQIVKQEIKSMVEAACGDIWLKSPILPEEEYDYNYERIFLLPGFRAGWTALHVASACSSADCVQLLLTSWADPLSEESGGLTPLDVAGSYDGLVPTDKEGFAKVIEILIKAGGKIHQSKYWPFTTPLHKAAELECLETIQLLLDKGASVARQNTEGQTPLHVCEEKFLEKPLEILANSKDVNGQPAVDVQNVNGQTTLYVAVIRAWMPGIRIALKAGADVTKKTNFKDYTPFHLAASKGNLEILNEFLPVAKQHKVIDVRDEDGATPLFEAIQKGHFECVKAILREGASINFTLRRDRANVFHKAAERGHKGILEHLIKHDNDLTHTLINAQCNASGKGYGPIHLAVKYNNNECVALLLDKGRANVKLQGTNGWTPLHLAAFHDRRDIALTLISNMETTVKNVDNDGWLPLHIAARYGNKETLKLLIERGHDVASLAHLTRGPEQKERKTALDMIFKHVPEPVEYLQDVFDSLVTTEVERSIKSEATNNHLQDVIIRVQYSVLKPGMNIVKALLKTGHAYDQKRLLLHPLLESYIYYKWKALMLLFYPMLVVYTFFVISLTTYVASVFFYNDTKEVNPGWLDSNVWRVILIVAISFVFIQELLYLNVKTLRKLLLHLETWIKITSYVCSIITARIQTNNVKLNPITTDAWPRHVATAALISSWIEMMFLISRFPKRGFYFLMFGKVATNILKILVTFVFLLIGFSLSFMIQFHTEPPFDGPWTAFVKTVVMITSEFDYGSLFKKTNCTALSNSTLCEENTSEISTVIAQIFFLAFLVLASIVLMNLMVGVAVNDIQSLMIIGNTNRLEKQVDLLKTMDNFDDKRILLSHVLPKKWKTILAKNLEVNHWQRISTSIDRNGFRQRAWKYLKTTIFSKSPSDEKLYWLDTKTELPLHIKDALVKITMEREQKYTEKIAKESELQTTMKKITEIHKSIVKKKEIQEKISPESMKSEPITNEYTTKPLMNDLHAKQVDMDKKISQITSEIDAIKQFMVRLECKLDKL